MDVDVWGDLSKEAAGLRKGEQIQIMGRLQKKQRPGQEDEKVTGFKVVAEEINRIKQV